MVGYILVLSSTVLYAVLAPLLKKANQQLPPFTVITICTFVLALVSLLMSYMVEEGISFKTDNHRAILLLVLVGLINAIGFWLGILGYKYMPLWQQSLFVLFTPVLTGIFAYFILGEVLSAKLFLGLVIMGIGLVIAVR